MKEEISLEESQFKYQKQTHPKYTPARPDKKSYFPKYYYEDVGSYCCEDSDFPSDNQIHEEINKSEWSVQEVSFACRLLLASLYEGPPESLEVLKPNLDENQLRRIMQLIYDAFRYKCILLQALDDIGFFTEFPRLESYEAIICLLMYAMHCRQFVPCSGTEKALKRRCLIGYEPLGSIDRLITSLRIKLAAAVAKLRIRTQTLVLGQLLPDVISDTKAAEAMKQPLMCWINNPDNDQENPIMKLYGLRKRRNLVFRVDSRELIDMRERNDFLQVIGFDEYLNDPICPGCIQCHNCHRAKFRSKLAASNKINILERSLCLAPVAFYFALNEFQCLPGIVAITHPIGMKPLTYLHNLLRNLNPAPTQMFVFGCNGKFSLNTKAVSLMNKPNVVLFSQNWLNANDILLEYCNDKSQIPLVAILANPPSSCTAVSDPVSIACARGGDISILEALTEAAGIPDILNKTEASNTSCHFINRSSINNKNNKLTEILNEQRSTLRLALSLPFIQMILYSTHSSKAQENQDVVTRIIYEANQEAALRYQKSLPVKEEEKNNEPTEEFPILETEMKEVEIENDIDSELYDDVDYLDCINNNALKDVLKKCYEDHLNPPQPMEPPTIFLDQIPDTELFELRTIDNWEKKGDPECYIACIIKKQLLNESQKQNEKMKKKKKHSGNKERNTRIQMKKLLRLCAPTFASLLRYHINCGLSFPSCCHQKSLQGKYKEGREKTRTRYSTLKEQDRDARRLSLPYPPRSSISNNIKKKQTISNMDIEKSQSFSQKNLNLKIDEINEKPYTRKNEIKKFMIQKDTLDTLETNDTTMCPWLTITPINLNNRYEPNKIDIPYKNDDEEILDRVYLTPGQNVIRENTNIISKTESKKHQDKNVYNKSLKMIIDKILQKGKYNENFPRNKNFIKYMSKMVTKKNRKMDENAFIEKTYSKSNYNNCKAMDKKIYRDDKKLLKIENQDSIEKKIEKIIRLADFIISAPSRS